MAKSLVMAKQDPECDFKAARINRFYKHAASIGGKTKTHLLAHLSWFKPHPKNQGYGKPVSVYYHDLYDHVGFVPVHFISCRCVSLADTLDGESVIFVVPCV